MSTADDDLDQESLQRLADVLMNNYIETLMTVPIDRPVTLAELKAIGPSLGITNLDQLRSELHHLVLQAMLDRSLTEHEGVRITPIGLRIPGC